MQTQTLHGVPKSKLKQLVTDFESEGFSVTTNKQNDGRFSVVATKADAAFSAADSDGDVVILNNVPADRLQETIADLTSEGYSVTVVPESDGEFTVIGTRTK
jgi:hypothetical protein